MFVQKGATRKAVLQTQIQKKQYSAVVQKYEFQKDNKSVQEDRCFVDESF